MEQLSLLSQYEIDKDQFIRLFAKFTGIGQSKISNFLESNSIKHLFEHPTAMDITKMQLNKINQLKELKNLYYNLKTYDKTYTFNSPGKAYDYFKNYFSGMNDKERFVCSFLDTKNKLITTKVMTTGTVDQSAVYPREIAKTALMYDANSVIIAHNHPSGNPSPSSPDKAVTLKVSEALSTLKIRLLDHVIVGDDNYVSFLESGLDISPTTVTEMSSSYSIKENIIKQYKNEFSAIRHITDRTAKLISTLNHKHGHSLTVNDIKALYREVGKRLEVSNTPSDITDFKQLQDIVNDFKQATLNEKKLAAHEKVQQLSNTSDLTIE